MQRIRGSTITCYTNSYYITLHYMVCSGVDAEYDQAISDIQSVEQALRDYLDQQKKILGCRVNNKNLA